MTFGQNKIKNQKRDVCKKSSIIKTGESSYAPKWWSYLCVRKFFLTQANLKMYLEKRGSR